MRLFRVGTAIAALLAASLVGLASPASARATAQRGPAVRAELGQLVGGYGIPGAAIVERDAATGGAVRGAAGLADLATGQPMAPMDRFRIASITKSFVATVVLQLVAEGRFGLDQPIEGLLPEPIPDAAHITPRELLDHSSGLFEYTATPGFDPTATYTPTQLLARAVQQPPYFAPGTGFHYSNTNYIALGEIIRQATGRSVPTELDARLLRPLHLDDTVYPAGAATQGRHQARGYAFATPLPPRSGPATDVTTFVSPSAAGASGAMVSNADDLDTFFASLFTGRLLPHRLLTEMERPTPGAADFFAAAGLTGVSYGLGIVILQTPCGPTYGNAGDIPGYEGTAFWRANREVAILIDTDSIQGSITQQILSFHRQELCAPR